MCIDSINDYYDVRLKRERLRRMLGFETEGDNIPFSEMFTSKTYPAVRFIRMSIEDKNLLDYLFATENFDIVVNLAAQAGVRYSLSAPYSYMQSNLVGFLNILEACRFHNTKKLVFASSSSVYGKNAKTPFTEDDMVGYPVSLYAASKRSNELMAYVYSNLYGTSAIGLRYFTVYGPWGRPDMSPMLFANAMLKGEAIQVFNKGDMYRDFTYIEDVVAGTLRAVDYEIGKSDCPNGVPCKIYNIGCGNPVRLMDFVGEMETVFGIKALIEFLPMQSGDVYQTYADTSRMEADMGFRPQWSLHDGIAEFAKWYKSDENPLLDWNN